MVADTPISESQMKMTKYQSQFITLSCFTIFLIRTADPPARKCVITASNTDLELSAMNLREHVSTRQVSNGSKTTHGQVHVCVVQNWH